ncbi:MucR family transcriptional regulator [Rhizobium sp. PRIMUS64]|jgi:predicted transcriptional regulator|uniref:MucR family transcriptional regulator n=1 Tax=Rhizobium sp. PRIMUS64 TaxID=2908925 RepID=UPI001FF63395|nr:MucR family transcriptional regulator [Rhizobium sp. PRIMUS64]MCJ9691147.1 MucR family transcriptional regulator [Rhizobium sp. PRIMUS64]
MAVDANLTELTALIVASFVSNNSLTAAELPGLIASTHEALEKIDAPRSIANVPDQPAVPIAESVTQDYLVCLNDGRKLRALKRYLQRKYSQSPEEYRKRWGLPDDYPMVAPAYSELRAKIAKKKTIGSGDGS